MPVPARTLISSWTRDPAKKFSFIELTELEFLLRDLLEAEWTFPPGSHCIPRSAANSKVAQSGL
jgi:hypothetical protein